MSTIDERVVKMTFDSSQFEKNVKSTMDNLSKFEKALKMDGATAGFDVLKQAANKLNLSVLGDKAQKEAGRIDKMSAEAKKSIDSIDDAASNADFSSLSDAAGDAVDSINLAVDSTDFSPVSDSANDAAMGINMAASDVDLSPISQSADEAAESFSALEVVATGVLLGLGEKISGFVTGGLGSMGRQIKEYTLDPIMDGFKEYQTQIGSIQTIMANTGMNFNLDKDIDTVNAALGELNTYADKTIYNFTEMTRNIGTFTAAGIKLEPATKAIKGIANLAALSGSNSQQASTAMYQLSQALAAGSLKLQDWNSVVNAGMGGQVFQNALKETARVHGVAVDEIIEQEGSFRESLKEGWITSEILTETLNNMSISFERFGDDTYEAAKKQLIQTGYTEDQATEILKLAKTAEESATKVRTWSQLWDTVKEALGSQWASVFQNIIGDFKQATDTFTFLSKNISNAVESMLGGIVTAAKAFNESGGISAIFGGYKRNEQGEDVFDEKTGELIRLKGAIDYLAEAISKPLGAIGDAFNSVFGIDYEQLKSMILNVANGFKEFTKTLVISDNAASGIRHIFEGLFSILRLGLQVLFDFGRAVLAVVGVLRVFTDPLIDLGLILMGQVGRAVAWIIDKFLGIRNAIEYLLTPITDLIGILEELASAFFGFINIPGKVDGIGDFLISILDILWNFVDLPGKIELIGDALRAVFGFIGDLTGWNTAVEVANKMTEEAGLKISVIDLWLSGLLENPVVSFIYNIVSAIKELISGLTGIKDSFKGKDALGGIVDTIKASFGGVGESISGFIESVKGLAGSIGSILAPVFDFILGFVKTIGTGVGTAALAIVGGLAIVLVSVGKGLSQIGSAISGVLSSGLPVFIGYMKTLAQAIRVVVIRLKDIFLSWEPIKGIIQMASDFKTKVVDVFSNMPASISKASGGISKMISGLTGSFDGADKTFNDIVKNVRKVAGELRNMSADQFVEYVKGKISKLGDIISEEFEKIMSLDLGKLAGNMMNSVNDIRDKIIISFTQIKTYLKTVFPSFNGSWFNKAVVAIGDFSKRINAVIKNAKDNSKSLPEFVSRVIVGVVKEIQVSAIRISKAVAETVKSVFNHLGEILFLGLSTIKLSIEALITAVGMFLNGEGVDQIKEVLSKYGRHIEIMIALTLSKINPKLVGIYSKIRNFFTSIINGSGGWKDAFMILFSSMVEGVKGVPKVLGSALSNLKSSLITAIKDIVNRLSNISGPIGDFFSIIADRIKESEKAIRKSSKNIPTSFDEIVSTIKEKIGTLWSSMKQYFLGDGTEGSSIVDRVLGFLGGAAGDVTGKIKDIPKHVGDFFKGIVDNISPETVDKVVAIVTTIAKAKLMISLRELFSGLGKLSKAFARRISKEDAETITEKMRSWAITFAVIAGALWVISTIPNPGLALITLLGAAAVVLAMTGISAILQKKVGKSGGDDILRASAGLLILAFAIKAIMKAVEELTKFDYEGNKTGIIALIGICALFAGFTKILGNGGKNAIQAAASLLIMSVAIRMLIGPIKEITEFATSLEGDALGKARDAVASLGLFILALAGAMKLAGSGAIGSGAGFVMMAAAVSIIADAMTKLSAVATINTDGLITSLEGIGVLMVVFGAMAKSVKPTELLAAGAAMVILSASISIIADAMAKTTAISIASPDGLIASFTGIATLMVIMGSVAQAAKPTELLATSAAMIALSASIAIIAVAISSLASIDSNSLTAAGNAMIGVLGVVGLMAVVLSMPALSAAAIAVLPMLSLALISLGAACLLIGIGLEHATTGIVNLALALPLLEVFTSTIAANVGNFILAAAGLGALGLAFAVFGPTALVAGAGIWFLANGIRDMLMLIIQLPELIPMAGESLASLFDIIVEKAEGLVGNLGEWWSSSVWPFLTSAFEQAKSWFVSTAIPMIGEWLGKFLGKAKEFISNLHKWWASNGPGILSKVREFITTFISKIGEVVPKLATWVSSKGIPAAVKAVKDIVNKAKDTLGPKISEFVKTIPSKLSSAINGIGSSIAATGRNIAEGLARGISSVPQALTHALQSLCSNALGYVKRFFGIKSPSRVMRDEVGRYIPEGMAVGILKFSDVLIDASKELTKTTVDAMNDGLNHANYAAFSPSIAPVVDMNGFNSDILAYNRALNNSMMNGSLRLNTGVNGEMSLSADLASRLDSDMDKAGTIASVIQDSLNANMAITEELVNKTNYILEALNGDTTNIRDALASGMNVYFDKSALIGAIAPEVDSALGRRTILAGRGVY